MPVVNPPVNSLIRMAVYSKHSPTQQVGINNLDFQIVGQIGGGLSIVQLANLFLLEVQGAFPAANATTVFLSGVVASYISAATGKVIQSAVAADNLTVGSAGATLVPSQVAPVATKVTGLAGRSKRGRSYFPFLYAGFTTGSGELTGAGQTALQAYYSAVYTTQVLLSGGGQSDTLAPVLVHRLPLPITVDPVLSIIVTGKLGTQRRRGDYGRLNPPLS